MNKSKSQPLTGAEQILQDWQGDADGSNAVAACELCGRDEVKLTRHHLIPQARHNKSRTKRQFSKQAMQDQIAMLCRPCHSQIHHIFDNQELAHYYHTIERLQAHSEVVKFMRWVKKRPAGLKIRVRQSL